MNKQSAWLGAVALLGVAEVLVLLLEGPGAREAPVAELDPPLIARPPEPQLPQATTLGPVKQAPVQPQQHAAPAPFANRARDESYPRLLQTYLDMTDWADDPGGEVFADAIKLLETDSSARARLLESLADTRGSSPALHWRKLKLLAAVDAADIEAQARTMIANNDSAIRSDGYQLMRMDASKDALERVLRGVRTESEPAAILSAMNALQAHTEVPPQEAADLTTRLRSLATHEDPRLRMASLGTLANLGHGHEVGETFAAALMDRNSDVVEAALGAIGSSSVRTATMKRNLLDLAFASSSSSDQRTMAAQLLTKFELSTQESDAIAGLIPQQAVLTPPPYTP